MGTPPQSCLFPPQLATAAHFNLLLDHISIADGVAALR